MNSINYENLKNSHPCFGQHPSNSGRIHLPVSPGCNIGCRFCERSVNTYEDRPGVTGQILTPEESISVVSKALDMCPQIKVVGIAGPGDTLASPFALKTFSIVKEKYPSLIKCMSTNGLLLSEKADEIIKLGIESLTVTVNAVDPEIEARLNKFIIYHGKRYEGVEAAEILIKNQLEGIEKIADGGITVKVNTVLVPTINDSHISEIAKAVSEKGAKIYNIIPLIPQFELKDISAPDCALINKARKDAERYVDVFRHCQHCRADAVGVPGVSDLRKEIYSVKLNVKETFSHG